MSDIPLLSKEEQQQQRYTAPDQLPPHQTQPHPPLSPIQPRRSSAGGQNGFYYTNIDNNNNNNNNNGNYDTYELINSSNNSGVILPASNFNQQSNQSYQTMDISNTSNNNTSALNFSTGFPRQPPSGHNRMTRSESESELRQTRVSLYAAVPDSPPTYEDLGITPQTNTLEAKHTIQNHMFGFRPFKSKIYKKRLQDRSLEMQQMYENNPVIEKGVNSIGNYLYAIFLGSLFFLLFTLISLILFVTYFGIPYGKIIWNLKEFVLWPFGKYLQKTMHTHNPRDGERQPLRKSVHLPDPTISLRIGMVLYYLLAAPFLILFQGIVIVLTWMIVVMIPTSKMHSQILKNLLTNPLAVRVEYHIPRTDCEIILYPVEAINLYYYKFTVHGLNVCLINLLPFVILSLVLGYFLEDKINPVVLFVSCLLSTIPLSYYNGMAIASLSAQTSFAMGALINASFGSIIELILYIVTINGAQEDVARSAITGSLLGALLLVPGLSMVIGGIKHKEQRFNPAVMGVSTVLLMVAVVGTFTPTIFYKIYGGYNLQCTNCLDDGGQLNCHSCEYVQNSLDSDPVYTGKARTLMYIVSAFLPVAYIIGLLFTLKTHTHILHPIQKEESSNNNNNSTTDAHDSHESGGGGHETEVLWGKTQCIVVLCLCTTMFALVSDKMVESIDPVVKALNLTHEFLGVTILGIIPSAAEYLNAIQFALHNNMPLALEIGASAAVQITLFQMPVLVYICAIINHLSSSGSFTLIFPVMDFFAVFFSVVVMNLVFTNGKTNYFIGSILVIVYLIIVVAFYFTPA
ncbi:DUF307 family protein [Heterostelium album PN500]|uniref:DUF307 family protein n=1 Tax=Heterostelium pallidum (strain ATCC 26659 / Pp 5 / PN500) TaxID=670386 RepID=D3B205_HETP5|nr:DUF307 family protein [Heterostelium album PN500]EFA85329.1 DUF307 family protein [Heterostelium album PN500]|eukprot:XP_020437438.1 DUF307 family protein [Heterostelium album PN500]